ncbi:MAG: prolipoprotein diacylglyceryl transferase family protein [Patescibacteria group bacterium]
MTPVLFELGSFKFYSFGTFIALGTVAGGLFLFWAARQRQLKTHHIFDTVLYTLLLALVGSRLAYYFLYAKEFQSFFQVFYFWQGGLIALGGLFVGFLIYLYFIRKEKDPVWQMLDVGALGFLVAWAVGKIGCHLSGCSTGRLTDSFLAINGSYPIDLFSIVWAGLLFALLFRTWLRNKLSDGVVFFLAMEGFFLGELLIKTLKIDFGKDIVRIEAIIHLALIVAIYLIFWKLHGPKIQRNQVGEAIKNFVFRRRFRS